MDIQVTTLAYNGEYLTAEGQGTWSFWQSRISFVKVSVQDSFASTSADTAYNAGGTVDFKARLLVPPDTFGPQTIVFTAMDIDDNVLCVVNKVYDFGPPPMGS